MSKKKNLLEEGTVRRFMQYANIGSLSESFIQERYLPEEEEEEMELGAEDDMGDMEDMGDMDDMGDMGDMDDMGDMEGEEMMSDTSEESVAGLVDAIADAISDYTGVDVSSEQTEDEVLDDLPPAEGDEMPMDQEAGEVPQEDDLDGVEMDDEPDEEEIIAETMKRVTRRIRAMQKRERLAETVTNRIMKKIAKTSRKG